MFRDYNFGYDLKKENRINKINRKEVINISKNIKRIKNFDGYFICDNGKVYCNLGKGYRKSNRLIFDDLYEILPRYTKKSYARIYAKSNKTGKRKDLYIHRLVAEHFIKNPKNKKEVNHKNCNPSDNRIENLEWTTHKENLIYSKNLGHYIRDKKGKFKSYKV